MRHLVEDTDNNVHYVSTMHDAFGNLTTDLLAVETVTFVAEDDNCILRHPPLGAIHVVH